MPIINGDGVVNIADPVVLLEWLFTNGPEPAICQGPEPVVETLLLPAPDTIVAITGREIQNDLKVGDTVELYEVPEDYYFQLRSYRADLKQTFLKPFEKWRPEPGTVQLRNGTLPLADSSYNLHRMGYVFEPGSTVDGVVNSLPNSPW